jgi:hypothetical protein
VTRVHGVWVQVHPEAYEDTKSHAEDLLLANFRARFPGVEPGPVSWTFEPSWILVEPDGNETVMPAMWRASLLSAPRGGVVWGSRRAGKTEALRQAAEKRLAAGLDVPPELLSENDLPGQWSLSDFTGGVDLVRGPGGEESIVAAGGWCAPSAVLYDPPSDFDEAGDRLLWENRAADASQCRAMIVVRLDDREVQRDCARANNQAAHGDGMHESRSQDGLTRLAWPVTEEERALWSR